MSDLFDSACDYLWRGLAVIALTGKTPNVKLHKHGIYDSLRGAPETEEDWRFVASFFSHPDTTGIGILTGEPYLVLDIDGEEGAKQWQEMAGDDWMPDRWVAKTGRGLHLWYAPSIDLLIPSGMGVVGPGTIKLGPKLDLKGFGGYVAAPPSLHPDGHTYEWLVPPGDDAPMEAPEPLLKEIRDHVFDLKQSLLAKQTRRNAWGPAYKPGDTRFYAQPGHDHIIEAMGKAEEGNRNAFLHWAAATLAEEGGADEEFEALGAAAIELGLTQVETRRTIRSARRAHG